ncbi:MAG: hypothetical protein ACK507_01100 [bacterium]|jgi:hypothetical protein
MIAAVVVKNRMWSQLLAVLPPIIVDNNKSDNLSHPHPATAEPS